MTTSTFDRLTKANFESALTLADIRFCLKTLEFYANKSNYIENDKIKKYMTVIECDSGYAARKALGLEKAK